MTTSTVIEVLLAKYMIEHPGYALPNGATHPSTLALSIPVMSWLMDRLGGAEPYWRHMLASAKVWFSTDPDPQAFKYFRVRFEGEGNIFWNGLPQFEALNRDYRAWRAQMAPNNSFKPNPLRGSA